MCSVENGRARFGLREWLGILGCMAVVAGLSAGANVALVNAHDANGEIHQSIESRQTMVYSIVDREIGHHQDTPHRGVEERLDSLSASIAQISTQLARIEERLERK